jgi:hypothetical protein
MSQARPGMSIVNNKLGSNVKWPVHNFTYNKQKHVKGHTAFTADSRTCALYTVRNIFNMKKCKSSTKQQRKQNLDMGEE